MSDSLASAFPRLGERLPKVTIARLPTPAAGKTLSLPSGRRCVFVKHDEISSETYGGNKVRKLEYLLGRALDRQAARVATFGAVGSNHALATAIHARAVGLECTCFLAHQTQTPGIPVTLNMHRRLGTEIVRFGSGIDHVALFRHHLQNRRAWVIPLGGTCWLGSVGFVDAGLELAQQISDGRLPQPERIYVACGTTGSAAGLAVGIAAAGLDTIVHAIQVAEPPFSGEKKLRRLVEKTRTLLHRIDPSFDAPDAQARIVWRPGFLAGGYAKVDEATTTAVDVAAAQLGLALDTTYSGKALTALLSDLESPEYDGRPWLFWNTYNACALPASCEPPATWDVIPREFSRYYRQ